MREHRTMTIKLEALHGQVMDALGYDFFSFSRYPEVFGEPGRRYFEVLAEQFHGWQRKIYDSHPPDTMEITPESVWTKKGPTAPSAIDLRRRPAVLDAMGIRRQLVTPALILHAIPNSTGTTTQLSEPPGGVQAAIDLLDAYNAWAAAITKEYSDRLRIPGVVPTTDASVAVITKRAEHLVALGLKLVIIPSRRLPAGLSPGHPNLDSFYATLAEANVPLILRGGSIAAGFRASDQWGKVPDSVFGKDYPYLARDISWPATVHQAEETFLTAMVMGGVFERHPTLRFGILKTGAQWLAPLAERMDRGVPPFMKPSHLPMKPSEYLNRNVRVTPWADGGSGAGVYPFTDSAEGGDGDDYEAVEVWLERYPGLQNCYCYSSDYPLDEGGKWSLRKFYECVAPLGDNIVEKYFVKNAELLMP